MAEEKVIGTTCASHCGGTCVLQVHVKDGVITRIDTDSGPEPQLRACLRGRAYRQRVYAPDRLLYPLKRVGERGEAKFERISWDEALETVAGEVTRVRDIYGPASMLVINMGGDLSYVHNGRAIQRVMGLAGGFTMPWGLTSFGGGMYASRATYGSFATANNRDDLLNSKFIILWGWDPATTICGTNTAWYLVQAKEKGARVISIDPKFTDTASACAHQWIPIRPGTDAAMALAMAYVIITENLQDQKFLDTYASGFDQFKDSVLGTNDGTPKNPQWAEAITGVPADTIVALAREYANNKPAALMAGIAPGRTAYGEQYHRAASILAAMTGNVGIHGGDAAGRAWESIIGGYPLKMRSPIKVPNPVDDVPEPPRGSPTSYKASRVHYNEIPDFILKGKAGGFHADCKLALVVNCNYLNQFPNTNKIAKALKALDFLVVMEQFMTPTAKFADIILPTTTFLERNDIDQGVGGAYYGFVNKCIEPCGETRSHLDIGRGLAEKLGITSYGDQNEEEYLREAVSRSEVPDFEQFRKEVIYRLPLDEPYVAFQQQIEDPDNIAFKTPSGKIEIYSQHWAELAQPDIPPLPQYFEGWETPNDPLAQNYPLMLITTHFRRRALSQFENLPWIRETQRQVVMLNSVDAQARGIAEGDMVRVFNDRGVMELPVRVTERIVPGVVDVPHGAWYDPDKEGVDRGGCANVLTKDAYSPGGSFPYNTGLVQVEKV
ncbi:MAG: molybdopterin-dependent oxidoreductase [Dehalococcoidia bacterium]|jgi:anaerobic dimethyl sulfoxide reductase subunit A|nr:molybdopterin-dependent oxidoreductase [Dehalococcoidia bacterium]